MLKIKKLNDEQLVLAIKDGDRQALLQLYKDNQMAVRNYILKNNGSAADAEDILQDATIAVWEKIQSDSLHLSAKLSTFVFAISKNLWLKRLNKMGRQTSMNDIQTENLTESTDNLNPQDVKIIAKLMEQLGDKCRQILSMFYFDNRDMTEIAAALEYNSADTAKAKKHQCFKQLQHLFLSQYNKQDFLGH
ncbi:MAG: RNA polymerase sigma factor [Chitinophagaceae bacterium]